MRGTRVKAIRKEMERNDWHLTSQGFRNVKKLWNKGYTVREAITELVRRDARALERSKVRQKKQNGSKS